MLKLKMEGIFLIGAGSHSKQIYDILLLRNIKILGIFDDVKDVFYQYKIMGKVDEIYNLDKMVSLFCGIGDNKLRREIFEKFPMYNWVNIIHPNCHISTTAKIGTGNYIGFNSYIGPDVIIGNGNIINEQAAILHDTVLGNYNHISIKSSVGARNRIGNENFFGMHSLSIPDIHIGHNNTIGANTTIIRNVLSHLKLVGSPARCI